MIMKKTKYICEKLVLGPEKCKCISKGAIEASIALTRNLLISENDLKIKGLVS